MIDLIWWFFIAISIVCIVAIFYLVQISRRYSKLLLSKRSDDVKRGFVTEQWLPLFETYPWNPQNFKFLGSPIDGIQFEEDRLFLVEFKSGNSRLSAKQKRIRDLVQSGEVEFREIRVDTANHKHIDII